MKPEDNTGGLAHFDAPWEKIDSRLKFRQAYSSRFGSRGVDRNGNLRISQIDGVKGRLLLKQIGVVDVQREIADLREDRLPAIVIVDFEIFRHQASKRIQCEAPDPDFETEGVKFLGEQCPPMSSEPLMIIVISSPRKQENKGNKRQPLEKLERTN